MQAQDLIHRALAIARDKHGADLRVLDVSTGLSITDYFVLVTAQNRRQAQAICAGVDREMKHAGVPKARIEGYQSGWWVLLDFDEVVIHIFQSDARAFYNLDELWADAKDLTADFREEVTERPEAPDGRPES